MSEYKAVIFDLDGTLLDTIGDIAASINKVMTELDIQPFSESEIKYFVGLGVNVLIEKVIEARALDKNLLQSIKGRYLEIYKANCFVNTGPYPGMMTLLNNLEKAGVSLNVLSNKQDDDVLAVMGHFFPRIRFANVLGKRKEFPIKPHPDSVEYIIKQLDLPKNQVLYIGDTATDIETAKNAGLVSIGILWGFRDYAELESAKADFIVSNPNEIMEIIKEKKHGN